MFTAFMVALTLTAVANVLITMALGPLLTALITRVFLGHRLPRRTWLAIALAGIGIGWMYGAQLSLGGPNFWVGSLVALEARHPGHFIRIHRHTLVARHAVRTLGSILTEHTSGPWAVRLEGVDEPLAVSRRQLVTLRQQLNPCCVAPPQCR